MDAITNDMIYSAIAEVNKRLTYRNAIDGNAPGTPLLTADVCRVLQVSERTVLNLRKRAINPLPMLLYKGKYQITRANFMAWMETENVDPEKLNF